MSKVSKGTVLTDNFFQSKIEEKPEGQKVLRLDLCLPDGSLRILYGSNRILSSAVRAVRPFCENLPGTRDKPSIAYGKAEQKQR